MGIDKEVYENDQKEKVQLFSGISTDDRMCLSGGF